MPLNAPIHIWESLCVNINWSVKRHLKFSCLSNFNEGLIYLVCGYQVLYMNTLAGKSTLRFEHCSHWHHFLPGVAFLSSLQVSFCPSSPHPVCVLCLWPFNPATYCDLNHLFQWSMKILPPILNSILAVSLWSPSTIISPHPLEF